MSNILPLEKITLVTTTSREKIPWTTKFRSGKKCNTLYETLLDMYALKYYCTFYELKNLGLPPKIVADIMKLIEERRALPPASFDNLLDFFPKRPTPPAKKLHPAHYERLRLGNRLWSGTK